MDTASGNYQRGFSSNNSKVSHQVANRTLDEQNAARWERRNRRDSSKSQVAYEENTDKVAEKLLVGGGVSSTKTKRIK